MLLHRALINQLRPEDFNQSSWQSTTLVGLVFIFNTDEIVFTSLANLVTNRRLHVILIL